MTTHLKKPFKLSTVAWLLIKLSTATEPDSLNSKLLGRLSHNRREKIKQATDKDAIWEEKGAQHTSATGKLQWTHPPSHFKNSSNSTTTTTVA